MPDSKITALTSISTSTDPANDPLVIVDVSDTSMAATGTTKKVTLNQLLGASGTATLASATITGDLTVRTTGLVVGSTATGIGTTPNTWSGAWKAAQVGRLTLGNATTDSLIGHNFYNDGSYRFAANDFASYYDQVGGAHIWGSSVTSGTAGNAIGWTVLATLNSTGLGVGVSPSYKLDVSSSSNIVGRFASSNTGNTGVNIVNNSGTTWSLYNFGSADANPGSFGIYHQSGTNFLQISPSGNVGIAVTPSAWASSYKALQVGSVGSVSSNTSSEVLFSNNYYRTLSNDVYISNGFATIYQQASGNHRWYNAPSGTAGNAITFTQAMTLDASGNLLVGTTSSVGKFNLTQTANANAVCVNGNVGNFLNFYGWSADSTWNTNATAIFVGKNTSTSRSINAGGTVNASGADYAEYMTKAGDFVLSKGGIAGIDANGKLTNVFADAVSFVVKSTDPSYVGNDKWGVDLEGDALESARQLVDRIAFAGQVPVNVIGAKAGDYIVPVVDGTGIKGIAVSNPTFEQYQLAVGKVIAIDADGRARIIVKVA